MYDEDLLPGTTNEDDDLLGRVHVELEGELTIDKPIQRWFTLTELGERSWFATIKELCRRKSSPPCLLCNSRGVPAPGAAPSGPEGSEAQVELDISFFGSEDRRREKEGRLRKRPSRFGEIFLARMELICFVLIHFHLHLGRIGEGVFKRG
jgi:hypothetical protein